MWGHVGFFLVNRIILVTEDLKFMCIRVFPTIFSFLQEMECRFQTIKHFDFLLQSCVFIG